MNTIDMMPLLSDRVRDTDGLIVQEDGSITMEPNTDGTVNYYLDTVEKW